MWFLRFVCGAFVWFAGVCFYARDDAHGPEVPDTAPGLPVIPLVPFNGNDSMPSSPPTYPSPNTTTRGYWDEPVRRARETVSKMNVSDLVTLVTGSGYGNGLCVGNIAPIPSIEFPGLCLQDSPLGLRGVDLATAFPPAITAAATFSKQLMYERGVALAEEFRDKGVNVFLGPMINVIRAPAAGRNWEGFGADPYVNGEGAYQTVLGVQSKGVQAVLKHYIANEQEHFRNTGSSNLDERTEREIYLHPFLRGIQAGAVSVMASYNFVNNTWMTQNPYLLNGRLKTELGFQGYVMSDWGAHHSGVASANAGLDMTMPGGTSCCELNITSYWGANLTQAVTNSSVPLWRVQDMATRILAAYYFVHQDEGYPKPNFNFFDINDPATNGHVNVMRDHHLIAREVATAGTVLLKNVNQTLPLRQPKKLVMIGSDAGPFRLGAHHYPDQIGWPYGPLGMGWGSGTAVYSYMISPYEAIQRRARADNTAVDWSFDDFDYGTAQAAANYTDAALVFVTSNSGEAYGTVPNVKPVDLSANMGDRNNLTLWNGGEELIKQVAAVNNNTIVVVHAVGPVTMEDWIDHPNVTAVVWANLPSSENGNALVNILYGTYNPSGRLPYTIARRREDYSADVLYNDKAPHPQINYTEQLGVDYRWFDSQNIAPRFEFGFGLSYTNFTYDDLHIDTLGATSWNDRWQGAIASDGLPDWLFDDAFKVHFNVSNTGGWDGFEVPQVYVGFPPSSGEPPRVLRAFDRVWVPRNQTTPVSFTLNYYDLSVWNATHQQWRRPEGDISVFVGASSRDLRLNTTLPSM
ncbi:beta-glucosidase [Malassezia pachydermatis]|uniref:beta-glucosidase n=1 Tax=Malassezia pachydermatis TaxID=77020 RepID=A0A0M8MJW6_9BASI|nr:beta-glucosidase [Malassezia pachydermatis]KOS13956.1 beta-glucosidase [Malassezia pachydermatis]